MGTRMLRRALATIILPLAASFAMAAGPSPKALEHFEKKVRPILVDNCYTCHSANTNSRGGLRVDDRNGLLSGGNTGAAVVPGDPEASLLIQAVRHQDDLKMPPRKKLTREEIESLSQWIKEGAAWPDEKSQSVATGKNPNYASLRASHWAWQPLVDPAIPAVRDTTWPRGDIDRFVLAKLEEHSLEPVGDAGRRDLIRRLTFDLTGLPPGPDEIDEFVSDQSPGALERAVDRLLGSPAYGEHWGRYWLDIARYGESTGSSRNLPFPHAWRYRDYVVCAFNRDVPYDQFVREQIAGNLLPARDQAERDRLLIATGFLAIGVKDVNQRFKVRFIMDNVDEQIDAVGRGILGTTVSCARCHDHKFDPIPTADYYALAGIFRSTDLCAGLRNKMGGGGLDYYDREMQLELGGEARPTAESLKKRGALEKDLAAARKEFQSLVDSPRGDEKAPDGRPRRAVARQKMNQLQNELAALDDPAVKGRAAMGVRDAKVIADTEIRIRGEAERLGRVVPRGFLTLIDVPGTPAPNPKQSGRRELAQWLTSPANPLTSRVIVNRVWHRLFDAGLVRSVDNFGVTGDKPSHPELLDHLAAQFVREGWSIKRLVRSIVLSRAYSLAAERSSGGIAADPANRWIWRHTPRRLTAEEIRDSILAATGWLDRAPAVGSPANELKVIELANNSPLARKLLDRAASSAKRSVYLPVVRDIIPTQLAAFDPAEQGNVSGARSATTVAPQALFLLNDPFVRRQSIRLAEKLAGRTDLDQRAQVTAAYRSLLGRAPGVDEWLRVCNYLREYESAYAPARADWLASRTREAKLAAADMPEPKGVARAAKRPAQLVNPDEVVQADAQPTDTVVEPGSARIAALGSFIQALVGSAEFRFLK